MPKKIQYHGRVWKERLCALAENYLRVVACPHCGSPINDGYICMFCRRDPTLTLEENKQANEIKQ